MDEDYETFGRGFDDDELQYPDPQEDLFGNDADVENLGIAERNQVLPELSPSKSDAGTALGALNDENSLRKKPVFRELKPHEYPPDNVYVHAIDWHMRTIDFEELQLEEWRRKREREEAVDRFAQKINEYRENIQREEGEGVRRTYETIEMSEGSQRCTAEIMDTPPIDGCPWMGVSADGNDGRFYIRLLPEPKRLSSEEASDVARRSRHRGFSERPIFQLMQEAEELRLKMASRSLQSAEDDEEDAATVPLPDTVPMEGEEPVVDEAESSLWVDKYKPKGFADLLSDDGVNRTLVTWIKLWDECVFHRKNKVENLVSEKEREMFQMDSGKMRRPAHKVLLLSGPAGLGKTTLAGVVARHAGYAVMEVNASDNRNIADFERVIEGAGRSVRTLDKDQRPSCLIIDEIDGAPGEAVRWLCRQLQATGKKAIRRPIIAICNNLFTPSLRELRQIALSVQMQPTRKERLVERLSTLSFREGVDVDRSVLLRLVELCGCDMRLSLNTLQYVGSLAKRRRRGIGEEEVVKAVERHRHGASSIFEQWALMLEINKHLDSRGIVQGLAERVRTIERVAIDHGDDRFVAGLHYNYTRHQPALPVSTLRKAAEQFVFYDRMNNAIQEKQNYSLMKYLIVFYAQLHMIVATHSRMKLQYPQIDMNSVQKKRECQETLSTIRTHLAGALIGPTSLKTDVLPLLVTVTQPTIKPMNESLYGARDREQLRHVVTVMSDFGVTFAPTMTNGQMQYLYEPSIDIMTMFNLKVTGSRMQMPNAVRQMIAHEIQLEHMRRAGRHAVENGQMEKNTGNGESADTEGVTREGGAEKSRKRAWDQSPVGKLQKKKLKKCKDDYLVRGVVFDYVPCGNNAVKMKVTLGQFLGF